MDLNKYTYIHTTALKSGMIGSAWLLATVSDWPRQVTQTDFGGYCKHSCFQYEC